MDTALKAMKRAARAVLSEDLKALRKRAKDAEKAAEARMRDAEDLANQARRDIETARKLRAENAGFYDRADRAIDWMRKNQSGNTGALCCIEFVKGPISMADMGIGPRRTVLNPFDRWQVSPAIPWERPAADYD